MTKLCTALAIAFAVASIPAGIYVGKRLAQPAAYQAEVQVGQAKSGDSLDTALKEGRLALSDLNNDSSRELVYFPRKGPPAIFVYANGDYTAENPITEKVYRDAVKFSGILVADYSNLTKQSLLAELDGETGRATQMLVAYVALQDPSLALIYQDKLLSASAATCLLEDLCNAKSIADFVLDDPKSAAVATLAVIGAKLLQNASFAYVDKPSYARWTKSGPGWENVGTVDSSGLVQVTPGVSVHIRDKAMLKQYQDLLNDPNVIWNGTGLVRLEHPIGMSREEYYRQSDRRAAADAQRRQFEQGVQRAYEDTSRRVNEWAEQTGRQAQQFQQQMNQHLDSWNSQVQQLFQRR